MKILVIEDSPAIVETISLALEMRWPEVNVISTALGENGLKMVQTQSPDAVILDLGLPDISGYDVLKRIRLFSHVPVLILTVRADESDIVKGLEWGADDYMTKPFKQLELLSRLKVIMQRRGPPTSQTLVCGALQFDPDSLKLTKDGREIPVSKTEGLIIGHLMRNYGNAVSHSSIAREIWGDNYTDAADAINVHIRHLREKLEDDSRNPRLILTKTGVGYLLAKTS